MASTNRATFAVAVVLTAAAATVGAYGYSSPNGTDCVGREHSQQNQALDGPAGALQSATVHELQDEGTNFGQAQQDWRADHCRS
jgi:hypothetical protein